MTKRPMTKGWIPGIASALLISGCTVGPKYARPVAPVPAVFKEAPPDSFKETKDWKTAQPGAPSLPPKWWETFGDAQLTALEEQAAAGNQDLKIAEARFREARAMIRFNRASEFPTISTNPSVASIRDSQNQPYFPLRTSATGEFVLPFDLSYEVDFWGRVRRTVNAAREEAQATSADLATATLTIQAELAYDYFELRRRCAEAVAGGHGQGLQRRAHTYGKPLRGRRLTEVRCRAGADATGHHHCAGNRYRCGARSVRARDCGSARQTAGGVQPGGRVAAHATPGHSNWIALTVARTQARYSCR